MNERIKILGIAGSLRKGSYNKALLRACIELKPDNMEIEIFDIKNIPFYNQDVQDIGFPEPVQVLKDKITECDGLLIATPEYNYSIPGVLKNAIDWVSWPPDKTPLNKKPVAFIGASSGISGTIRAQLHFRHVAQYNNMLDMKKPEILVTKAAEKFSPDGKLTDENTRLHLKKFLKAFEEWIYIFKLKEAAEGQNK